MAQQEEDILMSNFRYTKANLKKLNRNSLYKLLYAVYTSPLTRGQIVNELESRIPHKTWFDKENNVHRLFDKERDDYRELQASCWELAIRHMDIIYLNGQVTRDEIQM